MKMYLMLRPSSQPSACMSPANRLAKTSLIGFEPLRITPITGTRLCCASTASGARRLRTRTSPIRRIDTSVGMAGGRLAEREEKHQRPGQGHRASWTTWAAPVPVLRNERGPRDKRPGPDCTGARALLDHVVSASAAVPQQPIKSTTNSAGRKRAARTLFHPEGLVHTEDVVPGHSLWVLELAQE